MSKTLNYMNIPRTMIWAQSNNNNNKTDNTITWKFHEWYRFSFHDAPKTFCHKVHFQHLRPIFMISAVTFRIMFRVIYSLWDCLIMASLQWRHNEREGISDHRRLDCLHNRLFRRRLKKHQSSTSVASVRGIHRWPDFAIHQAHTWKTSIVD